MRKFLTKYAIVLYLGGLGLLSTATQQLTSFPISCEDFPVQCLSFPYPYLYVVWMYRFYVIGIASVLILFIPAYKTAKTEKRVKSNVRLKILKTIMTDIFDGDNQQIRITVFNKAGYPTIVRAFFNLLWRHMKKEYTFHCGFTFPLPFKTYLIASERVGTENKKSKAYFYVDNQTQRNCEGIAASLWQVATNAEDEGGSMMIPRDFTDPVLPDINAIDLSDAGKWTHQEKLDVETYMKATFVNNLSILRRLFIKARSFYAIILYNEGLVPVAVLVVDSVKPSHFDPKDLNSLGGYVKIFSTTFD